MIRFVYNTYRVVIIQVLSDLVVIGSEKNYR